jgi:hypothetical protein
LTTVAITTTPENALRSIRVGGLRPGVRTSVIAASFLVLLCVGPATAQDSQWWTNQYGNRARLLGGAVIGSARDLSAVYYNPGGLAIVDQPDALLTGFVFELDNIKYSDVLFEDTELSSTRFDAVAGLIAGQIPLGFLGESKLAYSYLTRHNLEYRFNRGGTVPGDSIPELGGIASASAAMTYETRLRETWGGLTWAAPIQERLGLGVSTFVAIRSQRLRYGTEISTVDDTSAASLLSQRSYDYYNWRLLWKVGFATSFDRWNVGATITTPSLRLFGSGDISYQDIAVLPDLESVTTGFERDIPSRYTSSWAIGAGGEYVGDDWRAHIAAEWFDRMDITILDGQPFRSRTDSTRIIDPDVTNVMRGLVNVALGYERKFSDTYRGYLTAFTDFTGSIRGDQSVTTTTPWDLWTVGAGASFTLGRSDFTVGLTYKFGGRDDLRGYDLIPDDVRDDLLLSANPKGSFWRLGLVLGFNLAFAPDM